MSTTATAAAATVAITVAKAATTGTRVLVPSSRWIQMVSICLVQIMLLVLEGIRGRLTNVRVLKIERRCRETVRFSTE